MRLAVTKTIFAAIFGLIMLASSVAIAAGLCHDYAVYGDAGQGLQILLATIGLLYSCLRITSTFAMVWERSPRQDGPRPDLRLLRSIRGLDRLAASIASIFGIWFIALDLARDPRCFACLAFWIAHYAAFAITASMDEATPRSALPSFLCSSVLLLAARTDHLTWTNIQAIALSHLPVSESAHLAKPGDSVPADINLKARTALVVWTLCPPCRQVAAAGPLKAFIAKNPSYVFWVVRGGQTALPKEVGDNWLIVPEFFYKSLGIKALDPPIYAYLDGHRIKEVGLLRDYR